MKLFKNKRAEERDNLQRSRYENGLFGKKPVVETITEDLQSIIKQSNNTQKTIQTMEKKFINLANVSTDTLQAIFKNQEIGLTLSTTIANLEGVKDADEVKKDLIGILKKNVEALNTMLITENTVIDTQKEIAFESKSVTKEVKEEKNENLKVVHSAKNPSPASTGQEVGVSKEQIKKEKSNTSKEAPVASIPNSVESEEDSKVLIEMTDEELTKEIHALLDQNEDLEKHKKKLVDILRKGYPKNHIVNDPKSGMGNAYKTIKTFIDQIVAERSAAPENEVSPVTDENPEVPETVDNVVEEVQEEISEVPTAEEVQEEVNAEIAEAHEESYTSDKLDQIIAETQNMPVPEKTYVPAEELKAAAKANITPNDYTQMSEKLKKILKIDDIVPIMKEFADFFKSDNIGRYDAKRTLIKGIQKKRNVTANGVLLFGNNNKIEDFVGKIMKEIIEPKEIAVAV